MEVKKVIIPIAGLASRFLPLSLAVPKEFLPLVDKPSIQYLLDEAKKSGITEVIFVVSPKQKLVLDYFKKHTDVEKSLIARKKDRYLIDDINNAFLGNYDNQKSFLDFFRIKVDIIALTNIEDFSSDVLKSIEDVFIIIKSENKQQKYKK